jgi:hypothetical protein
MSEKDTDDKTKKVEYLKSNKKKVAPQGMHQQLLDR